MDFLVSSCEQHPMLRDGTVLRSSAVTIGTNPVTLAYMTDQLRTLHTNWNILVPILNFSACSASRK